MSAPAVVEHLSLPIGFSDRRGRGTVRHRTFSQQMEKVRQERVAFLAKHGGRIPAWTAGRGMRTVVPLVRVATVRHAPIREG